MRIQKGDAKEISLSQKDMNLLKAREGDLLYVADTRRWQGGLRSLHVKAGRPHDESKLVLVPELVAEDGNLLKNRKVRVEKTI
jgi:SSS family solute:Na+ symporter